MLAISLAQALGDVPTCDVAGRGGAKGKIWHGYGIVGRVAEVAGCVGDGTLVDESGSDDGVSYAAAGGDARGWLSEFAGSATGLNLELAGRMGRRNMGGVV